MFVFALALGLWAGTTSIVEMAENRLQMNYRVPNKQLLEWSQRIVKELGDRLPKTQEEIYAREQVILHERQSTRRQNSRLSATPAVPIADRPVA